MRFLKILMKFIFLIHFFKSSLNSIIFRREMGVFHTNWSAKITLQLREIRIIYFFKNYWKNYRFKNSLSFT